jgi:hypothetical protein
LGVSDQLHAPVALPQEKIWGVPIAGFDSVAKVEKSLPAGYRTSGIQPISNSFTL